MSTASKALPALALSLLPDPFYRAITVEHAGSVLTQVQVLEQYFGYSLAEAQRTGRCVIAPTAEQELQPGCFPVLRMFKPLRLRPRPHSWPLFWAPGAAGTITKS
jgi:hypothetical protein